jgi:hypothetical protein
MGTLRRLTPVKLFVAVLVSDPSLLEELEARLAGAFGAVDHRSPRMPFDESDYYSREMGNAIDRVLFSFGDLVEADRLAEIKVRTNRMEQAYRDAPADVARPVNLDPGYIEQSKIVLASTKNFYHRIYMSRGVFAEVTMHFRNNTWQFFPWTYPDYQSGDYVDFFLRMRQIYRTQLKNRCLVGQAGEPEEGI